MVAIPLKLTSTKKKGDYEIRSYSVTKLQNLGQGATLSKMLALLGTVGAPIEMQDEGTALGYFNGTEKFRVAFEGEKPVAVAMKGETDDAEVFNKKFGKKGVFGKAGGTRRRRRQGTRKTKSRARK